MLTCRNDLLACGNDLLTCGHYLLTSDLFVYLLFYVAFNSQGHISTGSLQVEETSAYCIVNHRASASNYQLSNMKCTARDSNWRPQRLEAKTLTTTPPCPLLTCENDLLCCGNGLLSCGNDFLTSGHDLLSCGNDFITCGNNLLSCGNNLLTFGNNFITCGKDLSTCGNELLTCGNELLTLGHKFLSRGNEIKKCQENNSMSLPGTIIILKK